MLYSRNNWAVIRLGSMSARTLLLKWWTDYLDIHITSHDSERTYFHHGWFLFWLHLLAALVNGSRVICPWPTMRTRTVSTCLCVCVRACSRVLANTRSTRVHVMASTVLSCVNPLFVSSGFCRNAGFLLESSRQKTLQTAKGHIPQCFCSPALKSSSCW